MHVVDEPLWTCAWSSDGKVLAVAGNDRVIRIFHREDESLRLVVELKGAHDKSIRCLAFCPRRKQLAAASFDGTVSIWTRREGTWSCTATLEGHENEVKTVGWAVFAGEEGVDGDGEEQVRLVTCGRDRTVWVWAVESRDQDVGEDEEMDFECLAVLQEHEQDIKCMAWHPSQPFFLTGSYDETVRLWAPAPEGLRALDDWGCLGCLPGLAAAGTVWSIAFSPEGTAVAVATASGACYIYAVPERNWADVRCWELMRRVAIFEATEVGGILVESLVAGSGCCSSQDAVAESEEESGCCGGGPALNVAQGSGSSCCKQERKMANFVLASPELYSVSWLTGQSLVVGTALGQVVRVTEDGTEALLGIEHGNEVNCVAACTERLFVSCDDNGCLLFNKL